MYTWQIRQYFNERNWFLENEDDFYRVMWDSPQIAEYKTHEINDKTHSIYFCTKDDDEDKLEGIVWFNNVKN
jgi:hypothetical protein